MREAGSGEARSGLPAESRLKEEACLRLRILQMHLSSSELPIALFCSHPRDLPERGITRPTIRTTVHTSKTKAGPRPSRRPATQDFTLRNADQILLSASDPVIQPSFSSMIRLPDFAFSSECVT